MKLKDKITKGLLEELFVNQRLSVHQIAKQLEVKSSNSISQYIKKFGLTRPTNVSENFISKEDLYQKYVIENKSAKKIALEFGYAEKSDTINRLLKLYDIPIRKRTINGYHRLKDWKNKSKRYKEISGKIWSTIIGNAKRRNIEFNITIEYIWDLFIKQNRRCALSGQELFFKKLGSEVSTTTTASLDRIDSSKGYIEGNVQWVHKFINISKRSMSQDEYINICKLVANYNKG